jgi:flagellar hook-length control protein FliK
MANLLNAIPQANSNVSSFNVDHNSAKKQGNELKELFQKQLSENISNENSDETPSVISKEDLAEVALAAGAMNAPKTAPIDLKQNLVENNRIQAANQLVDGKKEIPASMKSEVTPEMLAAMKKADLALVGNVSQSSTDSSIAALMNGQDLMALSDEHEFDLKSVELKNVNEKVVDPKAASSKLSTADFLNLREISQNQMKPNAMTSPVLAEQAKLAPLPTSAGLVVGMKPTQKEKLSDKKDLSAAMSALAPAHGDKQIFGKVMDATVTQTAGQKPVLSNESVVNIGNQVNLLGQARQDGEVKIRLRPDHLGELQMSVRTQGQNVTVQIKAESNEAKKIIEDSLGALREHLSQQNLSLAKIDVVTQPTMASNLDQTQMQFDSNQNFNQSFMNQGERNGSQDGSQGSNREFYRDEPILSAQPAKMMRSKTAESTRLDLIA